MAKGHRQLRLSQSLARAIVIRVGRNGKPKDGDRLLFNWHGALRSNQPLLLRLRASLGVIKMLLRKPIIDPHNLDYVVVQLRALPREAGVSRACAIGKLLLTQIFAGDPQAWRDRRKNKGQSLRALAQRKNCPFSRSTLSQALTTYVTALELS